MIDRDEDGLPVTTAADLEMLPPKPVVQTSQQAETKRALTRAERGLCDARTYVDWGYDSHAVLCEKPANHDDPMAEVGSRRYDPIHQMIDEVDGVTITITWPSERS